MIRRISSSATFVNKRVFPAVWFGILAVIAVTALLNRNFPLLLIPAGMATFGYFIMRMLVFDLMDEVYLDEDNLIVRNGGQEDRIPVANIINVDASVMTNPERITLLLREPSFFGEEITFSPTQRWWPFSKHPIAKELIQRARGETPHAGI